METTILATVSTGRDTGNRMNFKLLCLIHCKTKGFVSHMVSTYVGHIWRQRSKFGLHLPTGTAGTTYWATWEMQPHRVTSREIWKHSLWLWTSTAEDPIPVTFNHLDKYFGPLMLLLPNTDISSWFKHFHCPASWIQAVINNESYKWNVR